MAVTVQLEVLWEDNIRYPPRAARWCSVRLPPKRTPIVENIVVDEANHRTYILLAPRLLSDGELYKAIRQEILRRGRKSLAPGETLTFTLTSSAKVDSVAAAQITPPASVP